MLCHEPDDPSRAGWTFAAAPAVLLRLKTEAGFLETVAHRRLQAALWAGWLRQSHQGRGENPPGRHGGNPRGRGRTGPPGPGAGQRGRGPGPPPPRLLIEGA